MTLVVFNSENGNIILSTNPIYDTTVDLLLIDVPDNKELIGIDPETKQPIYKDKEPSLEDRIAALEASQNDQDDAIVELADTVYGED